MDNRSSGRYTGKGYPGEDLTQAHMGELVGCVGVPDDLPETVLGDTAAPSPEALNRIKQGTLSRAKASGSGSSPPFLRGIRRKVALALAAALLVAAVAVSWAGPARVWAAVQRALNMVPGFGLIGGEDSSFTLIKAEQVRVDLGEGCLEVVGLVAREDRTYLSIYVKDIPGFWAAVEYREDGSYIPDAIDEKFREIYLVDGEGREYRYREGGLFGGSWSSSEADFYLELPPLDPDTRLVTLVAPVSHLLEIRRDIPLAALEEMEEGSRLPGVVTEKGITVYAHAHFGTETRISLGFIPPSSSVHFYNLGALFRKGEEPEGWSLVGGSGHEYQEIRGRGEPNYLETIYEGVLPQEEEVTLTIPALLLCEMGMDSVIVSAPGRGSAVELNKRISLGRFSFKLTRVEVVSYPHGDYLRVSVDLGPPGEETLVQFSLEDGFSVSEMDLSTGQWKDFLVPLEEGRKSYEFLFSQPIYSVEGPWVFTFQVD